MICPHTLISIAYPSPILSLFLSASATQASLLLLKHTRHTYTLDPGALALAVPHAWDVLLDLHMFCSFTSFRSLLKSHFSVSLP